MKEVAMEEKQDAAWSRSELTLRMTKQRAASLRAIAATLPGAPTPTQAIDHALARALAGGDRVPAVNQEQLDQAIEPLADQIQALSAGSLSRLDALERSLAQLLALISAAVGSEESF
jgi:hypothetical protein